MFLACSESAASAEFLNAFPTAYVLQALAHLRRRLDTAERATLQYGVLCHDVRHIVVCGHGSCRWEAYCRTLLDDADMGPCCVG
jgi:carbonic anhydrase